LFEGMAANKFLTATARVVDAGLNAPLDASLEDRAPLVARAVKAAVDAPDDAVHRDGVDEAREESHEDHEQECEQRGTDEHC
jgi:hypothetical protein